MANGAADRPEASSDSADREGPRPFWGFTKSPLASSLLLSAVHPKNLTALPQTNGASLPEAWKDIQKPEERAMTHFVMLFRQIRATGAVFLPRLIIPRESFFQHYDKTVVICKEETT